MLGDFIENGRSTAEDVWWHLTYRIDWELILRWSIVLGLCLVMGIIIAIQDKLPSIMFTAFLGGLFGGFVVLISREIRRWLIAVAVIDVVLQFDIYLGWDQEFGSQGTLAGLIISITTFTLAALYALWLLEILVTRRSAKMGSPNWTANLPLLFYISMVGFSVIVATNPTFTFYEFALLTQTFLLFVYLAGTVRSKDEIIFIMMVSIVGLYYHSIMVILQRFGMARKLSSDQSATVQALRVSGVFASSNTGGGYVSLLLPPTFALLLMPIKMRYKLMAFAGVVLGGIALIFMQSRGSWIASFVSFSILIFMLWKRGWFSATKVIGILIGVAIVGLVLGGTVIQRLTDDDKGSAESRGPLMQLAFDMVVEHPLFGVGSNNFATVMPDYIGPEFSNAWLYTVHNKYLIVWSETGTLGVIAFVSFLLLTIRNGWYVWQRGDPFLAIFALGLISAIIGHMFHMYVDTFRGRPSVQMLWTNAALIAALFAMVKQQIKMDGQHDSESD